jgi:uncharacterized protein (TIGR04255 family)
MTTDNHAMYRRAPVAVVAVEIKFPGEVGSPIPVGIQRAFQEVLGEEWITEQIPQPTLSFNVGGAMSMVPALMGGQGNFPPGVILRLTVRDRTMAVAITGGSLTVETTHYGHWPQFRSILESMIRATTEVLRPNGVTRVGLRYVDEIRTENLAGPVEWGDWLSSVALAPATTQMAAEGWRPLNWSGVAQYEIGEDRILVLRYGPQPELPGFLVNPDGPLRRPGPRPAGPFFGLDFDSFWQPSVVPEWGNVDLLEILDELRRPVRVLFDSIITERLVREVFNQEEVISQ